MKKVLAIVAIVMLVPFTAFGMEMMADTALEDVTGQAGVSISIDNVQMDFAMDYLSWGDTDGFADSVGPLGGGYVNLSAIEMTGIVIDKYLIGNSHIAPIVNYADSGFDPSTDLKYLTIDVGNIPTAGTWDATTGTWNASTAAADLDTAVRIGVPTLTVYVAEIADITVSLSSTAGTYAGSGTPDNYLDDTDVLGVMAVGGMQLDTLGGAVYILAH